MTLTSDRPGNDDLVAISARMSASGGVAVAKKILVILSEFGYWGEELVGPLHQFDQRGDDVVFATPTGRRAHDRVRCAWGFHGRHAPLSHGPRARGDVILTRI